MAILVGVQASYPDILKLWENLCYDFSPELNDVINISDSQTFGVMNTNRLFVVRMYFDDEKSANKLFVLR